MNGHYGHLSVSQEKVLQEMKTKVDADDHTLLRFLRARSFVLEDALELYKGYVHYRQTSGVEKVLSVPRPKPDIYCSIVPHAYHGNDKQGRPVYIEKVGVTDYGVLYDHFSEDELMHHHSWAMEYQVARCEQATKASKGQGVIDTFCSIIDLQGLSMSHRKGINLIRLWAHHDQVYYPERLGRLYIVNAPWVFPWFWKVCSAFLDANTIAKVHVLGKNYKEELLQYIDADQLPEEYGGSCACKGPGKSCVPVADISKLKKESSQSELDSDAAVELNVAARQKEEVILECDSSGACFDWSFSTTKDISFSVEVVGPSKPVDVAADDEKKAQPPMHKHSSTKPRTLLEPTRLSRHKGSFTCKGASGVKFTYDNTYSRMTSKTVRHLLTVTPLAVPQRGSQSQVQLKGIDNLKNMNISNSDQEIICVSLEPTQ